MSSSTPNFTVGNMSEKTMEAYKLRKEGLTYRQIALKLGITFQRAHAMCQQVKRALR